MLVYVVDASMDVLVIGDEISQSSRVRPQYLFEKKWLQRISNLLRMLFSTMMPRFIYSTRTMMKLQWEPNWWGGTCCPQGHYRQSFWGADFYPDKGFAHFGQQSRRDLQSEALCRCHDKVAPFRVHLKHGVVPRKAKARWYEHKHLDLMKPLRNFLKLATSKRILTVDGAHQCLWFLSQRPWLNSEWRSTWGSPTLRLSQMPVSHHCGGHSSLFEGKYRVCKSPCSQMISAVSTSWR